MRRRSQSFLSTLVALGTLVPSAAATPLEDKQNDQAAWIPSGYEEMSDPAEPAPLPPVIPTENKQNDQSPGVYPESEAKSFMIHIEERLSS